MPTNDEYEEWESYSEDEEDVAEIGEDDLLTDQHNKNLVATRGVDEEDLVENAAEFKGTPFLELIKDVHVLRTLYGPSDPTINDLAEEIESSLRMLMEQLRANPMGLLFEVAHLDLDQLQRARQMVNDMLEHYPEEEGG